VSLLARPTLRVPCTGCPRNRWFYIIGLRRWPLVWCRRLLPHDVSILTIGDVWGEVSYQLI